MKLMLFLCRKWGRSLEAKTDEEKGEEKRGFDKNGFNQFRSDRIPLSRTVPDNRPSRSVGQTRTGLTSFLVTIFHSA